MMDFPQFCATSEQDSGRLGMLAKFVASVLVLLVLLAMDVAGQSDSRAVDKYDRLPAELKPTDAETRDLLHQAFLKSSAGDFNSAAEHVQRALEISRSKKIPSDLAITESQKGLLEILNGHIDEASALLQSALNNAQKAQSPSIEADVLISLSSISTIRNDFSSAIKLLASAREKAQESKNLYIVARAYGELAQAYQSTSRSQEAAPLREQALTIDRINNFDLLPLHLLYKLQALAASASGQSLDLEPLIKEIRAESIKTENYYVLVYAQAIYGRLLLQSGKPDEALRVLTDLQKGIVSGIDSSTVGVNVVIATLQLPLLQVVTLAFVVEALQKLNETARSAEILRQLVDKAQQFGFAEASAGASEELGRCLITLDKPEEALRYLKDAANRYRKLQDFSAVVRVLLAKSNEEAKLKSFDNANESLKEIIEIAQKTADTRLEFLARVDLTRHLYDRKKYDEIANDSERFYVLAKGVRDKKLIDDLAISEHSYHTYVLQGLSFRELSRGLPEIIALERACAEALQNPKLQQYLSAVLTEIGNAIDAQRALPLSKELRSSGKSVEALRWYLAWGYFDVAHAISSRTQSSFDAQLSLQDMTAILSTPNGGDALHKVLDDIGPAANLVNRFAWGILTQFYLGQRRFDDAYSAAQRAVTFVQLNSADTALLRGDTYTMCVASLASFQANHPQVAQKYFAACSDGAEKTQDIELRKFANQLEILQFGVSDPKRAIKAGEQLADLTNGDPAVIAALAAHNAQAGNIEVAMTLWEKALRVYEEKDRVEAVAALSFDVGRALVFQQPTPLLDRALPFINRALQLNTQLGKKHERVASLVLLGRYYVGKGNEQPALHALREALMDARGTQDALDPALVFSELGNAYSSFHEPSQSLEAHTQSAELYCAASQYAQCSYQFQCAGQRLEELHKPQEALQAYLKSVDYGDRSGSWVPMYWSRRFLAALYSTIGSYEESISLFGRAESISTTAGQQVNTLWVLIAQSYPLVTVGRWEDALAKVQSALKLARELKDVSNEHQALAELVYIYGDRRSTVRDLDRAIDALNNARALAKANPQLTFSDLSADAAEAYWQLGKFSLAISATEELLQRAVKTHDRFMEMNARLSLAELYRKSGTLAMAESEFRHAQNLVRADDDFYTLGRVKYGSAGLLKSAGKFSEAAEAYKELVRLLGELREFSDPSHRQSLGESYSFIYDELISTLYSQYDSKPTEENASAALLYSDKNKSEEFSKSWGTTFLRELRYSLPTDIQERDRALFAKRDAIDSELRSLKLAGQETSADFAKLKGNLNVIQQELEKYKAELQKKFPWFASLRFPENASVSDLPLREGELLVAFRITDDESFAWFCRRSNGRNVVVGFYRIRKGFGWFFQKITAVRDVLNSTRPDLLSTSVLEELFGELFPHPHDKILLQAKSIIVIPDGPLFLLPLEMLSPAATKGAYSRRRVIFLGNSQPLSDVSARSPKSEARPLPVCGISRFFGLFCGTCGKTGEGSSY